MKRLPLVVSALFVASLVLSACGFGAPSMPETLPVGVIAELPAPGADGLYHVEPLSYDGFTMVCEGTQPSTGDDHIVAQCDEESSVWDRVSIWLYTKSSDEVVKQLVVQLAGDKLRNMIDAGVDPVKMHLSAGGWSEDLPAGEMPSTYSAVLAGKPLLQPMKMFTHGEDLGNGTYSASIGAVDEKTFFQYIDAGGKKVTLRFDGVMENVVYKEVLAAWRIPNEMGDAEFKVWKP